MCLKYNGFKNVLKIVNIIFQIMGIRKNDNLTVAEVEDALLSGRILEHYPDTGRGESCLVAGFTEGGKPIHIVCGRRGEWLVVITVYIPVPPKFKSPYERG